MLMLFNGAPPMRENKAELSMRKLQTLELVLSLFILIHVRMVFQ